MSTPLTCQSPSRYEFYFPRIDHPNFEADVVSGLKTLARSESSLPVVQEAISRFIAPCIADAVDERCEKILQSEAGLVDAFSGDGFSFLMFFFISSPTSQ